MLTKLEGIYMGGCAQLVTKYQFMPASVKATHPPIIFHPNNQVLMLGKNVLRRSLQFRRMAPIHAYKVNGAIHAVRGHIFERSIQETGKPVFRHLATGHGKVIMPYFA